MTDKHELSYYAKCMMAGILACGITYTVQDVMFYKTVVERKWMSVKPAKLPKFTLGWIPALIGYSLQGFGKFGFYEIFKDVYQKIIGEQNAKKYKIVGWAIASGCAQIIADIFLCPWEATKLKIRHGFYPPHLGAALSKFIAEQGIKGMYKNLPTLWAKKVPNNIIKFVAFQCFVGLFYDFLLTKPKQNYNITTQLSITFASGFLTGFFCEFVSYPVDTIIMKHLSNSKQYKSQKSIWKKIGNSYKQIGLAGFGTRIILIGNLIGLQWWIYDKFKTSVGLQTAGGSSKRNNNF